jgi:hypothetical protein
MKNPERKTDAIFNFLSIVASDQPEALQNLSPRDSYILFAHSDIKNVRTLAEMATIFEASTNTIGRIFKKALTTVYESSNPQIQNTYSLEEIRESIKIRHAEKTSEDIRKRFSDPEKRKEIIEKMSEGHRRSYRNNPDLRKKTGLANTKERYTKERAEKIRAKLKGRKRPPEDLAALRGKKRTPEVREKISISHIKRLQDPIERRAQATYGFRGKKHSKETKRKMSDSAIKRTIRYTRGWESSEDLSLWKYTKAYDLIPKIIEKGYLTQNEISALNRHFTQGQGIKNLNKLLNQLSLAVANLS